MQPKTPRFNEWLAAEKDAQAVERDLYAAILRFARVPSPSHLDDKVLSAWAKRTKASALFDEAMQEQKELAQSNHHRFLGKRVQEG